jgi:hypothetical protein
VIGVVAMGLVGWGAAFTPIVAQLGGNESIRVALIVGSVIAVVLLVAPLTVAVILERRHPTEGTSEPARTGRFIVEDPATWTRRHDVGPNPEG